MQVLAIYGSPRKGGNTDAMLDAFLESILQKLLTHKSPQMTRRYAETPAQCWMFFWRVYCRSS